LPHHLTAALLGILSPETRSTAREDVLVEGREQLAARLRGSGLDLGPGSHPFEVPAGVTVRYVDRWIPEENRSLFPELSDDVQFPKPDIVSNFDTDRLQMIESKSQDFVVASHVLEHLADPIGFLGDMYRVLRPGGLAIVLLPDLRRTFDNKRAPTPLRHLAAEHGAGVTSVDDDHIIEFLVTADTDTHPEIPEDPEDRAELLEYHRRRSIHVHCWTEDDFPEVLEYCADELDQRWQLLAQVPTGEGMEFGYLLRRARWPWPRRRSVFR
jgi:SAM-dependent methyltransferase